MRRRVLALLVSVPLAACGGTDEGRPSGEPPEDTSTLDPCEREPAYELQSIVDFDRTDNVGYLVCDPAAPCSFYFNYDYARSPENLDHPLPQGSECLEPVDPDAVVFTKPNYQAQMYLPEAIPNGRCGRESSGLHIVAQNVGMCYGADGRLGWGAALDITFDTPLDASAWDGIALWVRNSTDERRAFNFSVADQYTSGEPYCQTADGAADSEKCDAFGTAVTITGDWSFVPATFSTLRQKGFGVPSPGGTLDASVIPRLQLLVNAGSWDLWIDDIALFRSRE
jgi:hypothetical protein